eukprot:TRINITY_DN7769_c0_g1_i1.p1 TRINITY_DN7769_c0_g1~~TRINITY_DN7769_c0_g1_i1.p1  ORF type:complete len:292 (-),score=58.89 TRINITY_DN7769_c0_g1_i1:72-947(-)
MENNNLVPAEYLSELEDFKISEEECYDISDDPTAQQFNSGRNFSSDLSSLAEDVTILPRDCNISERSGRKVREAQKLQRLSGKKRFLFSAGEIQLHEQKLVERRYKVSNFQEHLDLHLGRRRSTGNTKTLYNHKITVFETIKAKNPSIIAKASSADNSRKPSSGLLDNVGSAPSSSTVGLLHSTSAASRSDDQLSSSAPSLSVSTSTSPESSRKSSSATLVHMNLRKHSSPAILEKRVLHGIPISTQLALPVIEIPLSKHDPGEVVLEDNPLASSSSFFLHAVKKALASKE